MVNPQFLCDLTQQIHFTALSILRQPAIFLTFTNSCKRRFFPKGTPFLAPKYLSEKSDQWSQFM